MTDELVERLRGCANGAWLFKTQRGDFGICDDAADRIEALTAKIEELRAERDRRAEMHECAMSERDDATLYADEQKARAEALIAERDSYRKALEDIIADCEADYPPSHGAIKYAARAALKGESK